MPNSFAESFAETQEESLFAFIFFPTVQFGNLLEVFAALFEAL